MVDEELERVLGYADIAIDFLKRSSVAPYPRFYELLFTYASGVNPDLNTRINTLFLAGELSTYAIETLYNEFLSGLDANVRISDVSDRVSARIEAVDEVIGTAMVSADAYFGSLEATKRNLAGATKRQAVQAIVEGLHAETAQMLDVNHQLDQTLKASREEIAELKRDLAELRYESMLDPLTRLFHRKSFDESLAKSLDEAERLGQPLSLILLDIDHFKQFNDSWGHQIGDQVLRLVASVLKASIRGRDLPARYGGEEFVIVLPGTDLAGAVIAAENVRKAIHAKELLKNSVKKNLGRVTASFGIAAHQSGDTVTTIIERADRCLYAAKHAGRNCVIAETQLEGIAAAREVEQGAGRPAA